MDDDFFDLIDIENSGEFKIENQPSYDESELLSVLNPEQSKAVTTVDGPLLILAGAGSGKTRVITYRIAYMLNSKKISPYSILAITFTNKAAMEMRSRIEALVGDKSNNIWCGTFHSIFARILRRHSEEIGYRSNFVIIDSDDQLRIVKRAMKELGIEEKTCKPKDVLSQIGKAKSKGILPPEYEKLSGGNSFLKICSRVYSYYRDELITNNSMDFDDILLNMVKLLKENPEILKYYQEKFQYILVDEYQDTNKPQYDVVMMLSSRHKNICVVGDDDQSIYAFRGADVNMILNFEKDFRNATVIRLEENYRSTKTILDAANDVIKNNNSRKDKSLRTSGAQGDRIVVANCPSGISEANWVADNIKKMKVIGKFDYKDVAVLYRVNSLSRTLESSFRDRRIPFKIYGGLRFYDRKEIKDTIAYLRLINDDNDNLAFERIINVPRRGIGDTTVGKIREIADDYGLSMLEVSRNADEYEELQRAKPKLEAFTMMIDEFRNVLEEDKVSFKEFVDMVENDTNLIDEIIEQRESKGETVDKVENLKELLSEAAEFERNHRVVESSDVETDYQGDVFDDEERRAADTLKGLLSLYLENAALYSEGDSDQVDDNQVKLMTIHSAKGLEFGAVFLVGVEEGVFPSYRTMSSQSEIEEERRLMYVAITRATKNLFLSVTRSRMIFGQTQCFPPSRFLREINPSLLRKIGGEIDDDRRSESRIDNDSRGEARSSIHNNRREVIRKHVQKEQPEGLSSSEISIGMDVYHPRFGEGKILKIEKVAGDALVAVDFDGMVKNLLLNKAGLKKGKN